MASEKPNKYTAPALDKGLDILEFISKMGVSQSQAEIAAGIDKTPNEIYRMLVCLEERGYLIRSENTGKYRLSLKMYSLSHIHSPFDELKRVAQAPMQQLSESSRHACHLSVIVNNQLMIISQTRSPEPISLSVEEGTLFSLSLTTSGKVLLSMIEEKKRLEILKRDEHYPKFSKKEKESFLKDLYSIRSKGYCNSLSRITGGVADLAVPIGTNNTEIVSALAVSSFTSELATNESLLNHMLLAKSSIDKLLGI
ncbi:MAG: IclR family transcriptional regulator [Reichenbachiella sp.]